MIMSVCSNCCFFKNQRCLDNQYFVKINESKFATPGFCRVYRSNKWSEQYKDEQDALLAAKEDSLIKADIIFIIDHLDDIDLQFKKSLNNIPEKFINNIYLINYKNKINQENLNDIKKIISNKNKNVFFHEILDKERDIEHAVQDISRKIHSKYFIVAPLGKYVNSYFTLSLDIEEQNTRFIFWEFGNKINNTHMIKNDNPFGLYITNGYKAICSISNEKSFKELLNEAEKALNIKLSCHALGCNIYS